MNSESYEDFGLKIEGAKKFLYPGQTGNLNLLLKQATKKNLWPEPPIGQKDRFVEFIIHKFRQCIRSSIKTDDYHLIECYINQILALKTLMESAETEAEVIHLIEYFLNGKDEKGNSVFNKELLLSRPLKYWELTRSQMESECFGYSKEEKERKQAQEMLKAFRIDGSFVLQETSLQFEFRNRRYTYPIDPKLSHTDLQAGNLIFIYNCSVIAINKTQEDYEHALDEMIQQNRQERKKRYKRKRIKLPNLKKLEHKGSDYRNGYNILPSEFQQKFAFYGGQFGNWVSQKERVEVVNLAYDALSDLAVALDIIDTDLSFHKSLGISFGARGSGKGTAHYEPDYHVINLTRIKGAGSLAHEWGHSLDHHLSELYGNGYDLLTEQSGISLPSLEKIINSLVDLKCDYRLDSLSLDTFEGRKKPYWSAKSEMFARAFNCYIIDKLKEKGIVNDYLCYEFDISIELANGRKASANPQGKTRKKLNRLFDQLILDLKRREVLHDRDQFKDKSFFDYAYIFRDSKSEGSQITFL